MPRVAVPIVSMVKTTSSRRAWGLRSTSAKAAKGRWPPRPWCSAGSRSSATARIVSTAVIAPAVAISAKAVSRGALERTSRKIPARAAKMPKV